ncbi:hypothetical protein Hanom_Chr02g00096311 [Helianthus anomalus]
MEAFSFSKSNLEIIDDYIMKNIMVLCFEEDRGCLFVFCFFFQELLYGLLCLHRRRSDLWGL